MIFSFILMLIFSLLILIYPVTYCLTFKNFSLALVKFQNSRVNLSYLVSPSSVNICFLINRMKDYFSLSNYCISVFDLQHHLNISVSTEGTVCAMSVWVIWWQSLTLDRSPALNFLVLFLRRWSLLYPLMDIALENILIMQVISML